MFKNFCIVGLGNHAKTKIIPALLQNGQNVLGLVSTQNHDQLPKMPIYSSLQSAIESLPNDTVFVLSNPPNMHFEHVCRLLKAGRDIFVEKPAFINAQQALIAKELSRRMEKLVVENLMYKHTKLFTEANNYWKKYKQDITNLTLCFIVPDLPKNTFRNSEVICQSILYDMGCYALSFLKTLSLELEGLSIERYENLSDVNEILKISGKLNKKNVTIDVRVGGPYQNYIEFGSIEKCIRFSPFFFGRAGKKTIVVKQNEYFDKINISDGDGFANMFKVPRSDWSITRDKRFDDLISVSKNLEKLGDELSVWKEK